MRLGFQLLHEEAVLPAQAHPGDAGLDLHSVDSAHIGPGERWQVSTGLAVEIPEGYAGLVLPRSGLAREQGVTLVNSPGLIDSGYRGEIKVLILNTDPAEIYRLSPGDRVAQLVITSVIATEPAAVESLSFSHRGEDGFGSSGR